MTCSRSLISTEKWLMCSSLETGGILLYACSSAFVLILHFLTSLRILYIYLYICECVCVCARAPVYAIVCAVLARFGYVMFSRSGLGTEQKVVCIWDIFLDLFKLLIFIFS